MKNLIKERESNFELLRILSMLLIILYHFVLYSDYSASTFSLNDTIYALFMSGGKLGVILFVMITGYYKIKAKDIKFSKLISLELQVLFYSIVFLILFALIGGKELSLELVSRMLFPNISKTYWFFSSYFILYLFMPYLNKLIEVIGKKDFERLLIIGFVVLILIPSVVIYNKEISSGIYLFYYYLVGGYIGLYGKEIRGSKKYLLGFLMPYLSIIGITMYIRYLSFSNILLVDYIYKFSKISSILLFASAVCLFMFFKGLNIGKIKIINWLASVSFGVYLFHDNIFMREFLWENIFSWNKLASTGLVFVVGILVAVLIYLIGGIIEMGRKVIFKYFSSIIKNLKAYK